MQLFRTPIQKITAGIMLVALFISSAAGAAEQINVDEFTEKVKWSDGTTLTLPLGLPADNYLVPKDNPMTKAKVALGKLLFFDVRLSPNDTIACATCHAPNMGFTDNLAVFTGIHNQQGPRGSPTIINRAFTQAQFWDGRSPSLEEQAKGPIISAIEMGMPDHAAVVAKLKGVKGYRKLFKEVFGKDVNIEDMAKAIAAFERTVLSGGSRMDRFNMGDEKALNKSEKRGLKLFKEKGRCNQCHAGFNLSDEKFHNIGIGMDKGPKIDMGRFLVTKKTEDIAAFKTPTLREITKTGPYMHDGRFVTLAQVVDFYDGGGIDNPFLDKEIKKLNLTKQEKNDIIAFLRSMDGTGWQDITPPTEFPE